MSKPNKVNPGIYTQRGRLTPDDAARELRKQRAAGGPLPAKARTAAAGAAKRAADSATTGTAAKTIAKPAAATKREGPPARQAVLARNAGGPGTTPRTTAKRRAR